MTCYIGLADLIRAKQASDRPQDRADVRVLTRAQSRGGGKPRRRRGNGRADRPASGG
jgi:hypothetical protein